MRIAQIILVLLVILVLQVTLIPNISVAGSSPDLVMILLVALVLDRGPVAAVIIGFLLGFMQDLGNASFLGMNAMAKSLVAYGVSRLGGGFLPDSVLFRGLLLFAASLVSDSICLVITIASLPGIIVAFFRFSILSAVYTALLGMVIMQFVRLFTGRVVSRGGGY